MIYRFGERAERWDGQCFVAPSADVIGSVTLGTDASIWFNAVVRGDTEQITIGPETNIQDGAVLHADPGVPLTIGRGVTVGHQAMIHGCTIEDYALIGIHAVVLNRARIGRYCVIGAGAVITEGKEIPERSVVMGCPGKVVRTLSPDDVGDLEKSAQRYVEKARQFLRQLEIDPLYARS
jgi:carbonic anhydrase/acetyltransferase-like protein (isoleucine patch superfamily)